MAGTRFFISQSPSCSLNCHSFQSCNTRHSDPSHVSLSYALINNSYRNSAVNLTKKLISVSPFIYHCYESKSIWVTSWSSQSAISFVSPSPLFSHSSYSFNKPEDLDVSAAFRRTEVGVGNDWMEKVKDAWLIARDALTCTGQKAQESSLLDVQHVAFPLACYVGGTVLAWFMIPKLLQRCHQYGLKGPFNLLSESLSRMQLPYEKSFWGSLQDPVRYLITFVAFAKIGTMVAPTTIASQYLAQAWRIAVILSSVWFLYRWKTNALTSQSSVGRDLQKMLILDKVSSVGLIVVGLMALALACDVAVHSNLFVGGIGGVAATFAARDIIKDVSGGLSMRLSKPFSIGDYIKIGSVEGQVVEMGLATTSLMNGEEFPVLVPNSVFFDEAIVNQSRAQWRAVTMKIRIQVDGLDKIPFISNEIKNMLRSNSKIFLGKAAPDCVLSRLECSFAELTLSCNLKNMNKDELHLTERDILLQSVRIIKEHGVFLSSTRCYVRIGKLGIYIRDSATICPDY